MPTAMLKEESTWMNTMGTGKNRMLTFVDHKCQQNRSVQDSHSSLASPISSHGDYGYHYHVTDSFPYTPGPDSLYGMVVNQQSFCGGTVGPTNGAGGGPPTDGGVTDGTGPPNGTMEDENGPTQSTAGEPLASSTFEAQSSESQSSGSTNSVSFLAMVALLLVAVV
jgi:hypothetical protein